MPMQLTTRPSHDDSNCPYCRAGLRRVPGAWLGRDGLECSRCGEFVDFSRPLTEADSDGVVDECDDGFEAPAPR